MSREPMLAGQIELMVLAVVARRPSHGYAIIEALRLRSGGRFDLAEGTIYPALHRLERAGCLRSDTQKISGRTRRTYRVTRSGRAMLDERRRAWRSLAEGVDAIVRAGRVPDHG